MVEKSSTGPIVLAVLLFVVLLILITFAQESSEKEEAKETKNLYQSMLSNMTILSITPEDNVLLSNMCSNYTAGGEEASRLPHDSVFFIRFRLIDKTPEAPPYFICRAYDNGKLASPSLPNDIFLLKFLKDGESYIPYDEQDISVKMMQIQTDYMIDHDFYLCCRLLSVRGNVESDEVCLTKSLSRFC